MKKSITKLTPLQIHLIGVGLGILSGIVIRPLSKTAHYGVLLLALGICLFAIYRYLKPSR